ncbi:MAG: hypothetical protein QNL12_02960 [Acidimicrobiia bacterium]|nr:hypothetical protein [Acidimicrobiia bacterium]MDX2466248.1 hypothetical protein [Acidimicrobiia bacterium]
MKKTYWAFVLILALVAAACGGDDSGDGNAVASIKDVATTTTAAPGEADELGNDEAAVLEFAACMRDGGIDFPDPVVDSDGNVGFDLLALRDLAEVDQAEIEAAFEPCAPFLAGVNFGFDRVFETEFQDELVAFSACMRDNGFDLPDPDFSALTGDGQLYPEFDLDDPDFEVALEACEESLPGIPGISEG